MKKCFFHLGFHKTASTYLQSIIELNRDGVLRDFHVVNRAKHETRPLKIALFYYAQKRNAEVRAAAVAECKRIIDAFEASGKPAMLISEEVLPGPMLRQNNEAGLYSNLETRLALLIECFARYEVHFLFYTRETAPWLRSLYNQAVKQVRFKGSYEAYIEAVDTRDIWSVLEKRVNTVAQGRPVRFFAIEDDNGTAFGAGNRLFEYIGLSEAQRAALIKPKGAVNASWPKSSLDLMRQLNGSQLDDRSLTVVRDIIKKNLRLFQ